MEPYNPATDTSIGEQPARRWWSYTILGAIFMAAGIFVTANLVLGSASSAIWVALAIIAAGAYQVIQALRARGHEGFLFDMLIGLLYAAGGFILLSDPQQVLLSLTLLLGIVWIASGIVRMVLAGRLGKGQSIFVLSGAVSIGAGLAILLQWPLSGLWGLGLCLGADLVFHGMAWIYYSILLFSEQPQRL